MKNYSKLLVSVLMLVSVFVIPIYASEGGKTEMSQMESNSSLSILEDRGYMCPKGVVSCVRL